MTEQGCPPSCVSLIPALLLGFDSAELSSQARLRDQPELYNLSFASDGLMHEAEASHSEDCFWTQSRAEPKGRGLNVEAPLTLTHMGTGPQQLYRASSGSRVPLETEARKTATTQQPSQREGLAGE